MEISGIIFSINLILFQMCYYCISRIISTSRIVYNKDGERKKKKMCKFHETREHRDSVVDVPIFTGRRGIAIKVVTIDI